MNFFTNVKKINMKRLEEDLICVFFFLISFWGLLTYKNWYIFNVYNLKNLEISIHPWKHHHIYAINISINSKIPFCPLSFVLCLFCTRVFSPLLPHLPPQIWLIIRVTWRESTEAIQIPTQSCWVRLSGDMALGSVFWFFWSVMYNWHITTCTCIFGIM